MRDVGSRRPPGCLIVLCLVVVSACGTTAAGKRDAESSRYHIHRDKLWSEVVATIRDKYPKIRIAKLDATRLTSDWMLTGNRVALGEDMTPFAVNVGGGQHAVWRPELLQLTVVITGANPYQIAVDVVAAVFVGTGRAPMVFAHGAGEEPLWVPGQKEELTHAIHERLKAYEDAP